MIVAVSRRVTTIRPVEVGARWQYPSFALIIRRCAVKTHSTHSRLLSTLRRRFSHQLTMLGERIGDLVLPSFGRGHLAAWTLCSASALAWLITFVDLAMY